MFVYMCLSHSAMTGPTGVGKTETAQVLARAILTKNELDGES